MFVILLLECNLFTMSFSYTLFIPYTVEFSFECFCGERVAFCVESQELVGEREREIRMFDFPMENVCSYLIFFLLFCSLHSVILLFFIQTMEYK